MAKRMTRIQMGLTALAAIIGLSVASVACGDPTDSEPVACPQGYAVDQNGNCVQVDDDDDDEDESFEDDD